jgi:acetyltransferase-like isoleucine patch superfamily enzyme
MFKFLQKLFFKTVQRFRIWQYRLLSNAVLDGVKPHLKQPLQAIGSGVIEFEKGVSIGFFPSPFFFSSYAYLDVRNKTSKIVIGENTSINNGFVAIAEHTSIKIGARVLIGTNVEIFDSDFHGINLSDRNTSKPEWARSVEVGDDVFIGSNVRICKGVTIGAGSVIANGSIVTHDVPVGVIAAGNPAVIVRRIS